MDNKIEVFKNEQFGEVRTILDGETLLFCGSDVARALGYRLRKDDAAGHSGNQHGLPERAGCHQGFR